MLLRLYAPLIGNAAKPLRPEQTGLPLISVVVRTGREPDRLEKALGVLLAQDYGHYEVVVVDDSRTEECGYLLERMRQQHPQLRVTVAASEYKFLSGENLAFTVGAKAARGEWLLFTESSAHPVGKGWVGAMATRMAMGVDLLLGYGAYAAGGSRLATAMLRWGRLMRLGYALCGAFRLADMCNLAIRKELFLSDHKRLGFADLRAGVPLYLSNRLMREYRVGVCMAPAAHVAEAPPSTWGEFLYHRRVRSQAQRGYPWGVRFALALEPSLRVALWMVAIAVVCWGWQGAWYALGAVLLRQIAHALLGLLLRIRLRDHPWGLGGLLADLLTPFLALYPAGGRHNVKKTGRWR